VESEIVAAAIAEAQASGKPVAELSLDRIAKRAGVSRSTMFRRVRSRSALETAVREAGVDPGRQLSVRDRAIVAATELIVAEGVGALTLEEVARRAGCAMTSVHTQCGGREGLLAAVFERYAPLPVVEQLLSEREFDTFEEGVRAVYTAVFDTVAVDVGVVEALIAEALAKPGGVVMQLAREQILPRITTTVGGWLTSEMTARRCTELPLSLVIPLLISPIAVHLIARRRMIAAGESVPAREVVIETMTSAFCGAVAAHR
jgi:AcrR family transcriptional regulator